MDKNNKIILLTGASSGIGYDTAVALAKQGHKVYAAARRVERMEPLRERGVVPLLSSNHKNDSAFSTRMPLSFSRGLPKRLRIRSVYSFLSILSIFKTSGKKYTFFQYTKMFSQLWAWVPFFTPIFKDSKGKMLFVTLS